MSAMHSLQYPRYRPWHAVTLSKTNSNSSSNKQALCMSKTYQACPVSLSPSKLHHTATTRTAAYTPARRQHAFPASIHPLTSQLSYVPNHPRRQTENLVVLRDTVGKGKTRYTRSANFSVVGHSCVHSVNKTPFQGQLEPTPAGQYRPQFDPHYDSRPVAHDVPPVRSTRSYTPDFHFLNQSTISPTVRNVRDFSLYRKTLPLKEYRPRNRYPRPSLLPSEVDHQHTYGYKKVEVERFRAVLENRYAMKKMAHLTEKYDRLQNQHFEDASIKKIRMTRASRGHAKCRHVAQQSSPPASTTEGAPDSATGHVENEQALPLFKIKRFVQVAPRTCSHRGVCPLSRPASPSSRTRG